MCKENNNNKKNDKEFYIATLCLSEYFAGGKYIYLLTESHRLKVFVSFVYSPFNLRCKNVNGYFYLIPPIFFPEYIDYFRVDRFAFSRWLQTRFMRG